MSSMTAKVCSRSGQVSSSVTVQGKGRRNKRKFWADPPFCDTHMIVSLPRSECSADEFYADKFEIVPGHEQSGVCDFYSINLEHSDHLKLDLGFSSSAGSSEVGPSQPREELEAGEFHDADWSDLTEVQLEELVLSNLDTIFKSAIKKIIACGYTEEAATKAVLRSGLYYGGKDTISNIVNNTLASLRTGQEIDPSREHCFKDLQQLEIYVLAELVCVLREIRPFFSTGDAMWCLLICDMNVSHACAMDGDPSSTFGNDDSSNSTSSTLNQFQLKVECKCLEWHLCSHSLQSATIASVPSITKPKISLGFGRSISQEGRSSTSQSLDKSFSATGTCQSTALEEKLGSNKRIHSVISKREYMLRQKSLHFNKGYRTYGTIGSSRSGRLSGLCGLILDNKLKSVSDSTAINLKHATVKISKVLEVDVPQDNGNCNTSANAVPSFTVASSLDTDNSNSISIIKIDDSQSTLTAVSRVTAVPVVTVTSLPASDSHHSLSAANTDFSPSLSAKNNFAAVPMNFSAEAPNSSYVGIMYDKSQGQWVPPDRNDEMVKKLLPKIRELQNQIEEWTKWANEKVMQAARRLGKEKEELKALRQEKVERLKKEKQTLEENTMKKLFEMEYAFGKARGQVERANSAVWRLEVENASLRQEMEAEKLRAAESAASCQEVSKREKKTSMEFQSWEKHKAFLLEEFTLEKHKLLKLIQELEQAKEMHEQLNARWQQEDKAKKELLMQTSSMRKEREQIEVSTKSKEDMVKSKAENNLKKYKDDVQKLDKEISQLRLGTESPKIAVLRRGINGSYSSKLPVVKSGQDGNQSRAPYTSQAIAKFNDYLEADGVKRERECVMCLAEEMSIVFLPCAHQVVCMMCNELHEKQGMRDCPSCRSPIQRRILVRYAGS